METFQAIVKGYLQSLAQKPSWSNYRQLYCQHFERWETPPTFQSLHAWHAQHAATPDAANKGVAFVRAAYRWATRFQGYQGVNPALGVRAHRTFSRERVMNSMEVSVVLGAVDLMPSKLAALIQVLLTTGCRLSEALAMEEAHVNLDTGHWIQPKTKNTKPHVTYLPSQARSALRRLTHGPQYFFEGLDGAHYSVAGAEKAWRAIRIDLGLADVRLHDFRRTLSTHLYRATKDEYLVKRCINHVNRSVTAIYVRISEEEVACALQAQADRFYAVGMGQPSGHALPLPVDRHEVLFV